jgi:hypothetical protein
MNLDQILAHINSNYKDEDILALVADMAVGKLAVRKQLADLVCRESAGKMSSAMIYEISKWGINDDLSLCPEIRALA